MKKIFTLLVFALLGGAGCVNAQEQKVWNFSDWDEKTFTTTETIEGLTVAASTDNAVTIDGNSKTIEGENNTYECTKRLKLGGAGNSDENGDYRYLKFDVTGNCKINVGLISSSSGEERTLTVAVGTFDGVAGTMQALGTPAKEQSYTYSGNEPTTIYLYSAAGGVNLYYIEVNYTTSTGINNIESDVEANPNAPVYNIAGQQVTKETKGILIQNGKKFINK